MEGSWNIPDRACPIRPIAVVVEMGSWSKFLGSPLIVQGHPGRNHYFEATQFLETNLASRWEGVRLPELLESPRTSSEVPPNFPGSFSATSPEVPSLWNLTTIQGFPGSFPDFPGSSPDFPVSFPDFPRGQPPSLGSLTPSPDSQELSLKFCAVHVNYITGVINLTTAM